MQKPFSPPRLERREILRTLLYAVGGTALIMTVVFFFNTADLVEERRDSAAWVETKERQVAVFAAWRRSLAPGGLLQIEEDLLDDFPLDLMAVRQEAPGAFQESLPVLEGMAERYRFAVANYSGSVDGVRRLGVLSLGTLAPGELPEQQAALQEWTARARDFQHVMTNWWLDLERMLASTDLTSEEQAKVRAILEERWEVSRNRIVAAVEASERAALLAQRILAIVEGAEGAWYFERRTGFPVFNDEGTEVAFNASMEELAVVLGLAQEARPRFVPVD